MTGGTSRFALLREMPPHTKEAEVGDMLARMAPVDIVLLDSFRRSNYPKMKIGASRTG
jgi:molybdopterin-guanine dinucleotide biosynthesis protein